MKRTISILVGSVLALLSIAPMAVGAQATSSSTTTTTPITSSSNALRISPVRSEVTMDPGTTKEITVYAQNLTTETVISRALVSDFLASIDESGTPNVILKEDEYAPSHSLKRLAITEPSQITMRPGERVAVKLKLTVPQNALPGGYYGAVRYVPGKDVSTGEDSGVAISTNVGTLVLLKVTGDIKEKASLASFNVRQNDKPGGFFKTSQKLTAVARFQNSGNVQTAPFGKITIKTSSGKVLEEHEINNTDPRGNVLPDSIRRFEVKLTKVGTFGKYVAEGSFGYGTGGDLISTKTSFWVVPVSYMIIAGVVLLLLILLIILIPRALSSYKRRILSRAGRRY